ncbi:antibiotic biosynthesis monooxygenase [Allomuricauda sp. SCSIO 65647]|uniref:antibiotic biosynthesis monooxygenase family protein n=1 Tax=Allomuricauda sp. SCSIO 65647 TaxID=2908843 RepID=UPI001F22A8AF|nr:antibiotic biosynthesis monooxygenase [Muricauda sp. SCSIO 65647]UJH68307.1 antibiotic biosynthesis monooxygenase [Muricauda sp. SCSIO 65647]
MFAVVYQFIVKENRESDFIDAWKQLTRLIYEHEGSLGSRLHKQTDRVYLAYAQWPDKETWKNSGNTLPDSSGNVRSKMRASCAKIEILYELDCTADLLKSKPKPH